MFPFPFNLDHLYQTVLTLCLILPVFHPDGSDFSAGVPMHFAQANDSTGALNNNSISIRFDRRNQIPTRRPNPGIEYHILKVIPDSTVKYEMPVIKPETQQ